jgi:hypothetical protein
MTKSQSVTPSGVKIFIFALVWCFLVFLLELLAEHFGAPTGIRAILFGLMAFGIVIGAAGVLRGLADMRRSNDNKANE